MAQRCQKCQIGAYRRGARGTLQEIVVGSYRVLYDASEEFQGVEIRHAWQQLAR